MVCVASIFIMDEVFNGVTVDFLFEHMNYRNFYFINYNRELMVVIVYCLGMLGLSICYILKLNRLLEMASSSIIEESPEILGEKCPEELLEFSRKLKEFKDHLRENEQARLQAEQQKNDLVVYLAHDLKTPIATIKSYGESIKDGIYPYETLEDVAAFMKELNISQNDLEKVLYRNAEALFGLNK